MIRSLDELDLFDRDLLDNPYPLYDRLRAESPVHRVAGTDFYLASPWDLVVQAAARTKEFSSNLTAALMRDSGGRTTVFNMGSGRQAIYVLATADDPVHQAHRKLVLPLLAARTRAHVLEPVIQETVEQLWHQGVRDDCIEWMPAVADRLPLTMIARVIGLPGNDIPRLVRWSYASTEFLSGVLTADRLATAVTSAHEFAGYLRDHFIAACADPGNDLLGDLARACATGDLTADAALLILLQLVGGGGESTAGLLGNTVRLLATDPFQQRRLREDPVLLGPFLEETLRLESPIRAHHRHVVADTILGDTSLPAGSHLMLLWGAANRDPSTFPDPNQIRLDRPIQRNHLAFGRGIHLCIGAALARAECRVALRYLLEHTDSFQLAPDPDAAQWVPSIFVRRHQRLQLVTT